MNEYPQERFHGLTASEVREAAKATDEPVLYPIKENKRIKKYWEGIDKKRHHDVYHGAQMFGEWLKIKNNFTFKKEYRSRI